MVQLLTGKPASQAMYKRAQSSSASSLPDLLDTSHAPDAAPAPSSDSLSPAFAAYMLQWFALLPQLLHSPVWFDPGSMSGLSALHVYATAALTAELSLNGTPLQVAGAAAWAALRAFACNASQAEHDIERILQQRFPAVHVMSICAGLRTQDWRCIWSAPGLLSSTRVPHVGTVHSSCASMTGDDDQGSASGWFLQLREMAVPTHLPNAGAALVALGLREHYHKVVSGAVAAAHTPLSSISSASLACGICQQCLERTVGADSCVYLELLLHVLRSPCLHEAFNHSSLLVRCLVDGMQRGGSPRQRELSRVCLTGIFTTAIHTGRGTQAGAATMVPSGARILSRPAVPHHIISMVCSALLMRVRITALSMQAAAAQERLFPGALLEANPIPEEAQRHSDTSTLSLLVMQSSTSRDDSPACDAVSAPSGPQDGGWEDSDTYSDIPQAFQHATRRLAETSHALQSAGSAPVVVLRGKPQLLHTSRGSRRSAALMQQVLVHTSQRDFFTPSFGPLPAPDLGEGAVFSLDAGDEDTESLPREPASGILPPPHQAVAPKVERLEGDLRPAEPLQVHVRGLQVDPPVSGDALSPTAAQRSSSRTVPKAIPSREAPVRPLLPQHTAAHRRWSAWSRRWDPSVAQSSSDGVHAPHADAGVGVLREVITFVSGAIALSHEVAQRVTSATARSSPAGRGRQGRSRGVAGARGTPSKSAMQLAGSSSGSSDLDTSFVKDVRHLVRCLAHCACRLSAGVCGEYEQLQAACTAVMLQGGEHAAYMAWTLLKRWPRSDSERCVSTLRLLVASASGWWAAAAARSISVNTEDSSASGRQVQQGNGYAAHQVPDPGRLRRLFTARLQQCLRSPNASVCTAAVKCVLPGGRGQATIASIISTDLDLAHAVAEAASGGSTHWNATVQRNLAALSRSLAPVVARLQAARARSRPATAPNSTPSGAHAVKFDKNPSARQVSLEVRGDSKSPPAETTAANNGDKQQTDDPVLPVSTASPKAEPSRAGGAVPPLPGPLPSYNASRAHSPGARITIAMASPTRPRSPASSPELRDADSGSPVPISASASGPSHIWQPPSAAATPIAPVRIPHSTVGANKVPLSPSSPPSVPAVRRISQWSVPEVRLQGTPTAHASPPAAAEAPKDGVLIRDMVVDERSLTIAVPPVSASHLAGGGSDSRRAASAPVQGGSQSKPSRGIEVHI